MFEAITHSKLKDFISSGDKYTFIVKDEEVGKAIGKQGANVRLLEQRTHKKIRIVGFHPELFQFIQNVIYPSKVKDIKDQEGIITLEAVDSKNRGYIIGRSATTLRESESIIKRHFPIKELKVM